MLHITYIGIPFDIRSPDILVRNVFSCTPEIDLLFLAIPVKQFCLQVSRYYKELLSVVRVLQIVDLLTKLVRSSVGT